MTHTISLPHIINCPICGSEEEWLEHDVRCSLHYTCKRCEHEWQIDPADEPEPDSVWDDWFPQHGIR